MRQVNVFRIIVTSFPLGRLADCAYLWPAISIKDRDWPAFVISWRRTAHELYIFRALDYAACSIRRLSSLSNALAKEERLDVVA